MQTNLEKKSIEARNTALVNNDYTSKDGYSTLHSDAISNGDPLGKGTLIGGHGHSIPNQNIPSVIKYENFNTSQGGGLYDIEGRNGIGGRNFLMNISKYNAENEYSINNIDMTGNEGQI